MVLSFSGCNSSLVLAGTEAREPSREALRFLANLTKNSEGHILHGIFYKLSQSGSFTGSKLACRFKTRNKQFREFLVEVGDFSGILVSAHVLFLCTGK